MNSNNFIVLACEADDQYAMELAVTITSLVLNHRRDQSIYLYLLDGGIQTENKYRLETA